MTLSTSNSKRRTLLVFSGRIAVLVAVVVMVQLWIMFFQTTKYSNYIEGWDVKQRALAEESPNRLIVLGGSNATFGIDSQSMEIELDRPVINASLHAGLGLQFMIKFADPYIRKNDCVVISLEYNHFLGGNTGGSYTISELASECPQAIRYFSLDNWRACILHSTNRNQQWVINQLFHRKQAATSPIYHADAFNEYGDAVSHLEIVDEKPKETSSHSELPAKQPILMLQTYIQSWEARGARVYVVPPALWRNVYQKDMKNIDGAWRLLRDTIGDDVVIGEVSDYLFTTELMFDTSYHLNREGREIRTARLIALLAEHFTEQPDNASSRGT